MNNNIECGPSGFWGLIIEPGKRYTKLVDTPFHITAAVLDTISTGSDEDEIVAVMLEVDNMEFVICNLSQRKAILQCTLNLKFEAGSRIAFYSTGTGSTVHLSGIVIGNKDSFSASSVKKTENFKQTKRKRVTQNDGSPKKIKATKVPKAESSEDSEVSEKENEADESSSLENPQSNSEEDVTQNKGSKIKDLQASRKKKKANAQAKSDTINGKSPKAKNIENSKTGASPKTPGKSPKVVKMGGVTSEDLVIGTGNEAKLGNHVRVYYEGRMASNGQMFDQCVSGKPFRFRIGAKDIIKGWSVGVAGMKVGGKRKIICPPHLAYGNRGAPPVIPPRAVLSFVIHLKAIG